jgi:hypothetical protein
MKIGVGERRGQRGVPCGALGLAPNVSRVARWPIPAVGTGAAIDTTSSERLESARRIANPRDEPLAGKVKIRTLHTNLKSAAPVNSKPRMTARRCRRGPKSRVRFTLRRTAFLAFSAKGADSWL